jgi:hypothetical protein
VQTCMRPSLLITQICKRMMTRAISTRISRARYEAVGSRVNNQPLAAANGAAPDATKDPLLKHRQHGAQLLEIRKGYGYAATMLIRRMAFAGWTFKSPSNVDSRYGHMAAISAGSFGSDGDLQAELGHEQGPEFTDTPLVGNRSRALSL